MNKKVIFAQLGMVAITMIWGITFVMVKDALNDAPPFIFATLRFGLAFIMGLLYLNYKIKNINTKEILGGVLCGFLLFCGYGFQNFGLMLTTPSKSAFITSVSVIFVPILLILFRLQEVTNKIWLIVLFATLGLYILLNPMGGGINSGDILTFGCALSFAFHVIYQDIYVNQKIDIARFFTVQVFFVFFFSLLSSFIFEDYSNVIISQRLIIAVSVTGVLATFIAIILMIWAQTVLSATKTAIFLSLEPVFAALFSVFFAGEILGFYGWIGGIIIVLSVMSSSFILPEFNKN